MANRGKTEVWFGLRVLHWPYPHHDVALAGNRPYIYDAVRLLDDVEDTAWPGSGKPDGLEFVHFPIVDCSVVSDARVLKLCKDLVKRLLKGENLYVHCW